MPREDSPDVTRTGGTLHVSPLLQLIAALALMVFIAAQLFTVVRLLLPTGAAPLGVAPHAAREQMIYLLTPQSGNPQELQNLINSGWRVVHVANAGAPNEIRAFTRYGVLMEHPQTKAQDFAFFTAGGEDAQKYLDRMSQQMRDGWRISQIVNSSATGGGGWAIHTVFVLEK